MSALPLTAELYSFAEVVVDVSMIVQHALDQQKWARPPDSRETIALIIGWAREFELKNAGRVWDGEYIEEIEAFTYAKLQIT